MEVHSSELRKEQNKYRLLEQKIKDSGVLKASLEQQIRKFKDNENLSDEKINSLIELNT
jgi:hypothetical protein